VAKELRVSIVAFTAYGVHWFALGLTRLLGGDPRPNAFMSVSFIFLSVLTIIVFFRVRQRHEPASLSSCRADIRRKE
jgi:hypothetical protein